MTKESKKKQTSVRFEDDLGAWMTGSVPSYIQLRGLFLDKNFLDWNQQTVDKARDTLVGLYARYGIRPFAVMNILAYGWLTFRREREFWNNPRVNWMRSSRKRSALLKKTHAVIEAVASLEGRYAIPLKEVRMVEQFLRRLPLPEAHRPSDETLRCCAGNMADFFEEMTGNPLYQDVGVLLQKAFAPEIWNPAGNEREAAKKAIKRRTPQWWIATSRVKSVLAAAKRGKAVRLVRFKDPIVAQSLMLQKRGLGAFNSAAALSSFQAHMKTVASSSLRSRDG